MDKIVSLINLFSQYYNISESFDLLALLLNGKIYSDIDSLHSILQNKFNIKIDELFQTGLITNIKKLTYITEWSEIMTIRFMNNMISNLVDIIRRQIRLWFRFGDLQICQEDNIFIIAYIMYRSYIDEKQVELIFSKLGKYIYVNYQYYIMNIDNKPLCVLQLLNKIGLININFSLLDQYIDHKNYYKQKRYLINETKFNPLNTIIDVKSSLLPNDLILCKSIYDFETSMYHLTFMKNDQEKIIIRYYND
jgi:hypothetical protein